MPNPLSYIFDIDSEWLAFVTFGAMLRIRAKGFHHRKINGGNALEEEGLLVIADNRPVSTEAATGFTQDRVVPASRNIKDFGYVKALSVYFVILHFLRVSDTVHVYRRYAIDARHYVKLKLNARAQTN